MDRVVVALGDGRYRAQPVRLGIESGNRVAIISGLKAGETIVVSGQFLIDSESNIESALSRMSDGADEDHSQHEMEPTEAPVEMDPEMDHSQHQMENES
jgi:Cu(I)/Ag(I) efflux system membrane fusion protein